MRWSMVEGPWTSVGVEAVDVAVRRTALVVLEECMAVPLIRVPVVCPECARESLTELPIATLAEALDTGVSIRLYARCHDRVWQATETEREQLRAYLGVMNGC